jgi:replicative DNA helicase
MENLRIPPHSEEAEKGVLGSLLLDPDCMERVHLEACDFYSRPNQLMWSELKELHEQGRGWDAISVAEWLKSRGTLERVGGYDYLVELQNDAVVSAHAEHYASIVKRHRNFRLIIEQSNKAIEDAFAQRVEPTDLAGKLVTGVENIGVLENVGARTTEQLCREALEIDTKIAKGERMGLPFPWMDFQNKTFGIPSRSVTPLAGRDGKGKSRLGTFLAEFWVKQGIPILYFPFEDGAERFISNVAATNGKYDMFTIKRPVVPSGFIPKHTETLERVAKFPLYVEDMPCTSEQLTSTIAKYKRKYGIEGVVVDGFKDMIPTSGENQTSKENHMNAVLVRAAKRYDVSIIPISHINKVDDDKWISKRDITGAGNQFKSARMVLLYQDHLPSKIQTRYNAYEGEIVLDATKTSYGNRGIVCLRPDFENGGFVEVREGENT